MVDKIGQAKEEEEEGVSNLMKLEYSIDPSVSCMKFEIAIKVMN